MPGKVVHMYNPIPRELGVQGQPWIHNKNAYSCRVCTREARQFISKKLHISPRPSGRKTYLGRRGLHVLMRWKRKERGWDQFPRLRKSLSKGSFRMKDDNRDWREPWTQHSLDHKRRGIDSEFPSLGLEQHTTVTFLGFLHIHPGRPSRGDSTARGRYGVILPLYVYLPLPQLSSTWVRQAFPPTLKNCCHHFNEDAKTGFRGLRGDVRPPNEGAAQPEEPWQGCREAPPPALMELLCSSCNRIDDNRTSPCWLASPTRDSWLRWCTPYTTTQRS